MSLLLRSIFCVLLLEGLGSLGAFITRDQISTWYAALAKPVGNPPPWVFGPVWTLLYGMLGVAIARIWTLAPAGPAKKAAVTAFVLQLALNLAWTPVFFGLHQMTAALLVIIALNVAIGFTFYRFRPLDRLAAALLIPYALWVAYATYLNAGLAWLNR